MLRTRNNIENINPCRNSDIAMIRSASCMENITVNKTESNVRSTKTDDSVLALNQ